jgi:hypothetical protein
VTGWVTQTQLVLWRNEEVVATARKCGSLSARTRVARVIGDALSKSRVIRVARGGHARAKPRANVLVAR